MKQDRADRLDEALSVLEEYGLLAFVAVAYAAYVALRAVAPVVLIALAADLAVWDGRPCVPVIVAFCVPISLVAVWAALRNLRDLRGAIARARA